ncbi:alpha/beta fold hydrolase [Sphingomonas solaris]|nr:alpha/beta fold hydrolase [Sphingomonas solaris]
MASSSGETRAVRKGFVEVDGRLVHYRYAGNGPAVVMLHDSPRSSRLHRETMARLADHYRVYALDTPGYGASSPLDAGRPTIAMFSAALGRTLEAMGLASAPLYATHTSAKIALDHAARSGNPPRLILDGLSIPAGPPDVPFIEAYMRPFRLDDAGGYLATEWTRMRDMLRWFPWFTPTPAARMPIAGQGDAWIADYVLDLLSAGPHYSSAYAAAMYYDPMPALRTVRCPTVVAARADDVLFASLERVPAHDNDALTVMRLPADGTAWLEWLVGMFAEAPVLPEPPDAKDAAAVYTTLPHGQMLVRRAGHGLQPLLILDAPTTLHARQWQDALGDRPTLVPDLPGYGGSGPLPVASIEAAADALAAMIDALGLDRVDVLGLGFATPLAAAFAARQGDRVGRVVLDGCFAVDDAERDAFAAALCPDPGFDRAGGHLHRIWHMLRDGEAQWPWFDGAPSAQRTLDPLLSAAALHPALVAILEQPAHYGDIARAAVQCPAAARYAVFAPPALILDHPDDPAYRAAGTVAALLPDARLATRAAHVADTCAIVCTFLDDAVPHPAGASRTVENAI